MNKNGAVRQNWTADPVITNDVLYHWATTALFGRALYASARILMQALFLSFYENLSPLLNVVLMLGELMGVCFVGLRLDLRGKTLQSAAMTDDDKTESSAGESLTDNKQRSQKSINAEKEMAERTKIRLEREAKALRDNLKKRKGQLRERK